MELGQEFYDNFPLYSKEQVNVALKIIRKSQLRVLYKAFVYDILSPESEVVREVINVIAKKIELGEIYKPRLTDYLSKYRSEDVINLFNNSIKTHQGLIRKMFVVDDTKELREVFPPNSKPSALHPLKMIVKSLESGDVDKNLGVKYVDFYTLLSNDGEYSKEEIDAVFSTLDDKQVEVSYKKFGKSLVDTEIKEDLTEEERNYFYYNVTRVMKRRLKQLKDGYIVVGIEELFSGYSKDQLLFTIGEEDVLSEYYFKVFGGDLSRKRLVLPNEIQSIVSIVQRKRLEKRLQGFKRTQLKPFYSLFEGERTEGESEKEFYLRVRTVASRVLNSYCQDILLRAYGENYDEERADRITIYERRYLSSYITPRIKLRLEEEKKERLYKPFIECFPIFFSRDEINYGVSTLNNDHLLVLRRKYGENLDEQKVWGSLTTLEEKKLFDIINSVKKRIYKMKSKSTGISVPSLKIIHEMTKTQEYYDLASEYGANIAVAVISNLYINDISEKEIINLTGVNAHIYLDISREYLEQIKGNNAILSLN